MYFTYPKIRMEILGFVNMNKTERITYAFNMRAPGGRYKLPSQPEFLSDRNKNITFVEGYILSKYAKFQFHPPYRFREEEF